jgi:predicted DNA-binding protein
MPFSLRLDPDTEARIRRIALATGRSKSAVVRDAMARYADADLKEAAYAQSTLVRLGSFIGVVSTGDQHATDTHMKYRAALKRKHRGRTAR